VVDTVPHARSSFLKLGIFLSVATDEALSFLLKLFFRILRLVFPGFPVSGNDETDALPVSI
jgi:hypothetical protein